MSAQVGQGRLAMARAPRSHLRVTVIVRHSRHLLINCHRLSQRSAARLFCGAGSAGGVGRTLAAKRGGAERRDGARCLRGTVGACAYARRDACEASHVPRRRTFASRRSTAAFLARAALPSKARSLRPGGPGAPAAVVTNHGGGEPLPAPPSGPSPEDAPR